MGSRIVVIRRRVCRRVVEQLVDVGPPSAKSCHRMADEEVPALLSLSPSLPLRGRTLVVVTFNIISFEAAARSLLLVIASFFFHFLVVVYERRQPFALAMPSNATMQRRKTLEQREVDGSVTRVRVREPAVSDGDSAGRIAREDRHEGVPEDLRVRNSYRGFDFLLVTNIANITIITVAAVAVAAAVAAATTVSAVAAKGRRRRRREAPFVRVYIRIYICCLVMVETG